jgi:hypothetical protein
MKILKSHEFTTSGLLAEFVNYNGIQREDILNIVVYTVASSGSYVIYYYGDPNVKEKSKSLFGWN